MQAQAKFINSFKNGDIWNSTMIMVKEGRYSRHSQGAKAAAVQFGCSENIEIPVLNCECIDWVDDEESKEQLLRAIRGVSKEDRQSNHKMYYADEVKHEISTIINHQLQSACDIIFQIEICTKCSAIGDHRCMPFKCHLKKETIHEKKNVCNNKSLNAVDICIYFQFTYVILCYALPTYFHIYSVSIVLIAYKLIVDSYWQYQQATYLQMD